MDNHTNLPRQCACRPSAHPTLASLASGFCDVCVRTFTRVLTIGSPEVAEHVLGTVAPSQLLCGWIRCESTEYADCAGDIRRGAERYVEEASSCLPILILVGGILVPGA